jgi:hypothetical protein
MARNDRHLKWKRILFAVLMLSIVGACGGAATNDPVEGATSTTPAASSGSTETQKAPSTTVENTVPVSSPLGGSPGSFARITIGDQAWDFTTVGFAAESCNPNFAGGFFATLYMADENGEMLLDDDGMGSGMTIGLPPAELAKAENPPSLKVSIAADDVDWIANPNDYLGEGSGIDSFEVDGNHAEGTAKFAPSNGGGVETGSFEVTCAD